MAYDPNTDVSPDYWKERYMQLRNIIIGDSTHMIGKVRDRYKELERKEYDWKSFYNGWLEGRSDFFQKIIQFEALIEIMQTDEEAGLYDDETFNTKEK